MIAQTQESPIYGRLATIADLMQQLWGGGGPKKKTFVPFWGKGKGAGGGKGVNSGGPRNIKKKNNMRCCTPLLNHPEPYVENPSTHAQVDHHRAHHTYFSYIAVPFLPIHYKLVFWTFIDVKPCSVLTVYNCLQQWLKRIQCDINFWPCDCSTLWLILLW